MVLEYRVNWSGPPIEGDGVTVFHGRGDSIVPAATAAADLANRARTFFDAIKALVPTGLLFDFPAEVTDLNTTTGDLEAVHVVTKPADVASTAAAGTFSKPSGARIDWATPAIVAGRRLRGRTFLVPLVGTAYDSIGTLAAAAVTTITTAANVFITGGGNVHPSVWSRIHGIQADITSVNVPDEAAVLRSRRD
jgi:hypothetical protein